MSKNSEKAEVSGSEELAPLNMPSEARDWFLSDLVRIVNLTDSQFSVTLVIPGGIISGMLIGGKKYFDEFSRDFSKIAKDDEDERSQLADFILEYGSFYDHLKSDDPEFYDLKGKVPQFIHLMDARYFSPGQTPIPTNGGVLWRGNLDSVAGFSYGQFSVREGDDE